jgi:GAF domain-containing protein
MTYPKSADDDIRVDFLRSLAILDTARDENLERIVRLCRTIFGVGASNVSLVDGERQWFKSYQGLDVCETDREVAFCNHTILGDGIFEVPDALENPVFRDNPLVVEAPHIRYYAGAPLAYDGIRIGALCLIDFVPRAPLSPDQRAILSDLAAMVVREFKVQRLLRESIALLADV